MIEPDLGSGNGVEAGYYSGSGSTGGAVAPVTTIKRTRSGRISIDVPPQLLAGMSSGMTTPVSGDESVGLLSGEPSATPTLGALNSHLVASRLRAAAVNSVRSRRRLGQALFCAGGIYACYIYYGLLQERLYSKGYVAEGGEREKFKFSTLLIFVQCIFNVIFAIFWSLASRATSVVSVPGGASSSFPSLCGPLKWLAFRDFSLTSFSYVGAIVSSNVALHYVTYPTQVLGKSCKMIPVMICGVALGSAKYSVLEYLWVMMVTGGIIVFTMANQQVQLLEMSFGLPGREVIRGPMLLFVSLLFDGVTGASQDMLVLKHQPTSTELMMFQNIWGSIFCFVGLVCSGEGRTGISFLTRHRSAVFDLGMFAVCSASGQFFIFLCIRNFGSLFCTTITTTRKFFTILASVLWFQHSLGVMHWMGVAMVFFGIFGKIYGGGMSSGIRPKRSSSNNSDWDSKLSDWDSGRDASSMSLVGPGGRNGKRNGLNGFTSPGSSSVSTKWLGR